MGKVSPRFGMHGATRLAFAAFAAALMAGCADSSHFMGDPLGNPFRSASNDAGRDVPGRDMSGRDMPSRDLPSRDMAPPPPYRPVRSAAITSRPLAPVEESRHVADYATPAHANPRLASSYQPPRTERTASIAAPSGHGSWSAAGGMSIIAGTGDTAGKLAERYNVPTEALLHENGLSSANQIQPGTRLVIPVYSANGGASRVASAEPEVHQPRDHSSRARLLEKHEPAHAEQERTRVAKAEPVREAAPEPAKPHGRELAMTKAERAKADRLAKAEAMKAEQVKEAQAKVAQAKVAEAKVAQAKAEQLKAAHSKVAEAKLAEAKAAQTKVAQSKAETLKADKLAKAEEAKAQAAARKLAKAEADAKKVQAVAKAAPAPAPEQKVAKLEEAPRKAAVDPTPTASLPPPPAAAEKVSANGNPEFRWPAHGRIIQGFKSGGNDGINIAVPEGTQVKAAESGVVAYAGNEIKGFGNLVLIRHPNGYVTAYANNADIAVRRGEQVKRGQTIAKSGQSGNVASPQLHFELRKGSTPVDPTRYLAGL